MKKRNRREGIIKEKRGTIRQCISCRKQLHRENLIRIIKVIESSGSKSQQRVMVNPNKHQFGRSIYICKDPGCIDKAIKGKKIARMLRVSQNLIDEEIKGGEYLKTA